MKRDEALRRKRANAHKQQRIKQVRRQRMILAGVLVGLIVLVVVGISIKSCAGSKSESTSAKKDVVTTDKEEPSKERVSTEGAENDAENDAEAVDAFGPLTEEQTETVNDDNKIRFVCVGDNLIHEKIYKSGIREDGTWNYDHLYAKIKDDISSADIAMVNQECVFVKDHENVSGYPAFGAPTEVGDAVVNAGFDIVGYANNHVWDKEAEGVVETLDFWKNNHPEMTVLGIHGSQEDADTVKTIECKGLKISLLNFTSTINGECYDEIPSYAVDLMRHDKVVADAQKAVAAGDFTIALLHTGTEYSMEPNQEQRDYMQILLDEGVDLTVCAGPHVVQGTDTLTNAAGNKMVVFYSLGNFISTQQEWECMLGGMADVTLAKDEETGEWSISDSKLVPLMTHYNVEDQEFFVCKLEDYTEELAKKHEINKEAAYPFTLQDVEELFQDTLVDGI